MGILSGLYNAQQADHAAENQDTAATVANSMAQDASNAALAENKRQYDTTRADFKPYTDAGVGAIGRLDAASKGDMSGFMASPDYNFRRSEGDRDIGSSFAARGGAASGNALKALDEYNSNLASGEFGNWWSRQGQLAQIGQGATGNVAQAGQNATSSNTNNLLGTAQNAGSNLRYAADARASGINNGAAAINRGGNNAFKVFMSFFGGGGGGGGGLEDIPSTGSG